MKSHAGVVFWLVILGAVVLAALPPTKPVPFVIRESRTDETLICAEYRTVGVAKLNRSCQSAVVVREWILKNGRPTEECHTP